MCGTQDTGERPSTMTVVLRLWTPACTCAVAFRLSPEIVIMRRQDRRRVTVGDPRTDAAVLPRSDVPGEVRRWLSMTRRYPAGRTVLQISLVDPDRLVWGWAEVWYRNRRGWYRIGYGDNEVAEAVPVDQQELSRQVLEGLLRRVDLVAGSSSGPRE